MILLGRFMTATDTKSGLVANQTMGWYSSTLLMLHCAVIISQQTHAVGQGTNPLARERAARGTEQVAMAALTD